MTTATLESIIEIRRRYQEYLDDFDPTPQYLYDDYYTPLDFEDWLDEIYLGDYQ